LGEDSAELPGFPLAKNGVDWNQVYGSWCAKGWNIDNGSTTRARASKGHTMSS
jgi:hypothetical protein